MKSTFRHIAAFIVAWIVGSIINLAIVNIGPYIIPLPEGADISSAEALAASMNLFKPQNFIFPFLGHALGTMVGAFAVAKMVSSHKLKWGMAIGLLFFFGGIAAIVMMGGPLWFKVIDLLCAYFPMAWIGSKIAMRK